MYFNVNGATGKIRSIESAAHTYDAHCITIAETKFTSIPLPIKGYKWYQKIEKTAGGGGLAIAVRDDIFPNTKVIENLEDQDQEVLWIELNNTPQKVFLGVYYGKQETEKIEQVQREFSQLETQIDKLQTMGSVILTGDFNAKIEVINKTSDKKNPEMVD